jgi:hypothetical protein
MKYRLGEEVFSSKKAITEHVRRVRDETPVGAAITDAAVIALLKLHPRWDEKTNGGIGYPGCDVLTFSSNLRPSKEIVILFPDDTPSMDISWKKIVERLQPDGSLKEEAEAKAHLDKVRKAARNAIRSQLLDLCCEGHHIDHVFPLTFEALLFRWMLDTNRKIMDFDIVDVSGTDELGKQFAEPSILISWQEFHAEHAKLEVIPIEEHHNRPKLSVPWAKLL